MNLRKQTIAQYWKEQPRSPVIYAEIDPQTLRRFTDTHPKVMHAWLPPPRVCSKPTRIIVLLFAKKSTASC